MVFESIYNHSCLEIVFIFLDKSVIEWKQLQSRATTEPFQFESVLKSISFNERFNCSAPTSKLIQCLAYKVYRTLDSLKISLQPVEPIRSLLRFMKSHLIHWIDILYISDLSVSTEVSNPVKLFTFHRFPTWNLNCKSINAGSKRRRATDKKKKLSTRCVWFHRLTTEGQGHHGVQSLVLLTYWSNNYGGYKHDAFAEQTFLDLRR